MEQPTQKRPAARRAAFERMLALLEMRAASDAPDPRHDGEAIALLVELATTAADPRRAA